MVPQPILLPRVGQALDAIDEQPDTLLLAAGEQAQRQGNQPEIEPR